MKQNLILALDEAKRKQELGLLVWDEIPDEEEHSEQYMNDWWVTESGDRETLYSISSLYGSENIGGEGTSDEILDMLIIEFPNMS